MSNQIDLGFDIEALINKGKKRSKYKFEYLKDGTQAFRILPSFDPANRRLEHTYALHWLSDAEGKSIKTLCTYYTEKFCPICNAHKDTKASYDHAVASDPNSVNTKNLAAALQKLSVSKANYYNAVSSSGEPVILELNSTVTKALEALIIEAYQKKGFDATAIKGGVWFEFTKTGKGRDSVRVDYKRLSKLIEGEMVDILDRSEIGPELVARLPTSVANIHDPKVLYIKEFSSSELSDYLRGIPLPSQRPVSEVRSPAVSYTPAAETVKEEILKEERTVVEAISTTAPAALNDYASHAERLKKLANPTSK